MDTYKSIILFVIIWLSANVINIFTVHFYCYVNNIADFQNLVIQISNGKSLELINHFKMVSIINHILLNLFPVLLFTSVYVEKNKLKYLFVDKIPTFTSIGLYLLITIILFPFISYVYYLNYCLVPESWISEKVLSIQFYMMEMTSYFDLFMNLLLVGIVAAVGEELLYRAMIHRFLMDKFSNIHVTALISSLLFSFMHFQPEGFIPRFIMGYLFAYILLSTKNLWITIVLHIFFNSSQVLIYWFYPHSLSKTNKFEEVSLLYALFSILISIFIFRLIDKKKIA